MLDYWLGKGIAWLAGLSSPVALCMGSHIVWLYAKKDSSEEALVCFGILPLIWSVIAFRYFWKNK